MLSSKNLPLAGTKKFRSWFVGPIAVVALVGPVAVCLALTRKLWGLHLVFHVSLLRRYKPGGDGVKPPPTIIVDEEAEYKVKTLLSHQVGRGVRQYLVFWRGYDSNKDSWLSEIELEHS